MSLLDMVILVRLIRLKDIYVGIYQSRKVCMKVLRLHASDDYTSEVSKVTFSCYYELSVLHCFSCSGKKLSCGDNSIIRGSFPFWGST